MKAKILIRENQFLKNFFKKERIDAEEDIKVKRLGNDVLFKPLWENAHSWAGSTGQSAWLIFPDGEIVECLHGLHFSDNGRTTCDTPPVPLWQTFVTEEGEVHEELLQKVEVIAVRDWDKYNSPNNPYDEFTFFVRPKKEEIRKTIDRELRKEITKLREIVG